MQIELTEKFWDTLNPDKQEDGTAWMFTDDIYFVIGYLDDDVKCFYYHNPILENPLCMTIDPWFKTAGTFIWTDTEISLKIEEGTQTFWTNKVVPFKRV